MTPFDANLDSRITGEIRGLFYDWRMYDKEELQALRDLLVETRDALRAAHGEPAWRDAEVAKRCPEPAGVA